ncbi:hypothetical protein V2J09_022520 [Rumex salicifolius]
MAVRMCPNCFRTQPPLFFAPTHSFKPTAARNFSVRNSTRLDVSGQQKLVLDVKEKLEKEHSSLPVGKNGRDDEEMIFWFLKDRKFSVDDAVVKLTRAIKWRQEFGVAELSEDSVRPSAETGKAYVHDSLDVNGRPVLIVIASKHFPGMLEPIADKKLCVFLVEKALSNCPPGQEQILGIFDLRGFGTDNIDMDFLTFVFEVFYSYYPKRLGQLLFVEAPSIFRKIWRVVRPLLKSHAALVRFCSLKDLKDEYFTDDTLPPNFKDSDG